MSFRVRTHLINGGMVPLIGNGIAGRRPLRHVLVIHDQTYSILANLTRRLIRSCSPERGPKEVSSLLDLCDPTERLRLSSCKPLCLMCVLDRLQ